jgi:hypothetical protein
MRTNSTLLHAGRRWLITGAVAVALLGPMALTGQPASAAVIHHGAAGITSAPFAASSDSGEITCAITATYPANTGGVMIGTGEIMCSGKVASIADSVWLYRNGDEVDASASGCNECATQVDSASLKCAYKGYNYWYTAMVATVIFPEGYTPENETVAVDSVPSERLFC